MNKQQITKLDKAIKVAEAWLKDTYQVSKIDNYSKELANQKLSQIKDETLTDDATYNNGYYSLIENYGNYKNIQEFLIFKKDVKEYEIEANYLILNIYQIILNELLK